MEDGPAACMAGGGGGGGGGGHSGDYAHGPISPERRIAFARQPEGWPVALYTEGRDRKATHEIPTDGERAPATPLVCFVSSVPVCRGCASDTRLRATGRLEVLAQDGEWLEVRTGDRRRGWVKRKNVVYR